MPRVGALLLDSLRVHSISCAMATAGSSSAAAAAAGKKRKRIVLTIEDKLKVCDLVQNGRSLTSVAAEFNTAKSTVHDISSNLKYQ